jgi:hypothetical protein
MVRGLPEDAESSTIDPESNRTALVTIAFTSLAPWVLIITVQPIVATLDSAAPSH